MADNVGTVMSIYDAFGRGDVAAILEQLDPQVAWEPGIRDTGLPHLEEGSGVDHVEHFFSHLHEWVELTQFDVTSVCDGGDTVVVMVITAGRVVGGGEIPPTLEAHVWRFGADGRVVAFNHVFDLAVHEHARPA